MQLILALSIGLGGEAASLDMQSNPVGAFQDAGYQSIITNSSYQGGLVRQAGNLSFARVFQAGHGVAWYQPETSFRVFDRLMSGRDIATGQVSLFPDDGYGSEGPSSMFNITNENYGPMKNVCYVYEAGYTCTQEQIAALKNGTAVIQNYIVVRPGGSTGSEPEPEPESTRDSI